MRWCSTTLGVRRGCDVEAFEDIGDRYDSNELAHVGATDHRQHTMPRGPHALQGKREAVIGMRMRDVCRAIGVQRLAHLGSSERSAMPLVAAARRSAVVIIAIGPLSPSIGHASSVVPSIWANASATVMCDKNGRSTLPHDLLDP